jgi:hypothetical protein
MASQGPENSYATLYALIFPNSRVVRKNQKSLVGLIYPVRTVERMDEGGGHPQPSPHGRIHGVS